MIFELLSKKRRIVTTVIIAVTVVIFIIAAVLGLGLDKKGFELVLYDTEDNTVYRRFSVNDGDEFSVSFVHSVNKSPVTDVFVIRNGGIYADRTVYAAFGAGVQSTLEEGQALSYDDEGNMVVSGFDTLFPEVRYIVGTVYDHVLKIGNGNKEISLTELCGKNAHVAFALRRRSLFSAVSRDF